MLSHLASTISPALLLIFSFFSSCLQILPLTPLSYIYMGCKQLQTTREYHVILLLFTPIVYLIAFFFLCEMSDHFSRPITGNTFFFGPCLQWSYICKVGAHPLSHIRGPKISLESLFMKST